MYIRTYMIRQLKCASLLRYRVVCTLFLPVREQEITVTDCRVMATSRAALSIPFCVVVCSVYG